MITILFFKQYEISEVVNQTSAVVMPTQLKFENYVDAVNITLASYGFICSMFPIA